MFLTDPKYLKNSISTLQLKWVSTCMSLYTELIPELQTGENYQNRTQEPQSAAVSRLAALEACTALCIFPAIKSCILSKANRTWNSIASKGATQHIHKSDAPPTSHDP